MRRLLAVSIAIVFAGFGVQAGPNQPPLFELRRSAAALVKAEGPALLAAPQGPAQQVAAEERFKLTPDAAGEIPYFIALAANKSGYRSTDENLIVWALQEWERSVSTLRFRRIDDEHTARIRVQWLPWAEDAALGRMEPSSDEGRPVASLIIRPDENKFRPTVRRRVKEDPLMRDVVLYYVCLHEVGHALGLSHSENARDIMWPGANGVTLPIYDRYRHHLMTRDDIPGQSWLSHDDIARANTIWLH